MKLRMQITKDPEIRFISHLEYGLYPFFSLLKIQPSGTAFAPAKSHTFKRRE